MRLGGNSSRSVALAVGAIVVGIVIVVALSDDSDQKGSTSRDSAADVRSQALLDDLTLEVTKAPPDVVTTAWKDGRAAPSAVVSFAFSAPDATGYACALDTATHTPCPSGRWAGPVGIGKHNFKVHALGRAGMRGLNSGKAFSVVAGKDPGR